MTLRLHRRRARSRWLVALGAIALISALATGAALAVHDDGKFELDKNASNNTNVTAAGNLTANITATATALNICQVIATGDPTPAAGDTILIRAERMTMVTNASGSFGGNCTTSDPLKTASKRVYTVTRGADSTTARAQAGGGNNVGALVSLIKTATKAGPDWNQVYSSVTGDANDTGDDDKCIALGLVECAFIEDGIGPSIFIGGNTKDHILTSSWQHTTGSSPDKGEILNAYAGKAISPAADNTDNKDHQLLYFGMDRYAVDGSTDIGFWFFKQPVAALPDGTFGPGTQTTGDILALGTFTQGGATSNIRVFKWVGSGGNESGTIQGPEGTFGDCVPGAAGDAGCATVNNTTIEVPWTYTFKGESVGKWVPLGGFFEGGIDLTANGLDGCFSSFLAETRSSPEITAVLKDFALGSFEACDAGLTTVPGNGTAGADNAALTDTSDPANGIVDTSIGTGSVSVRDRATLTVSGVATWSGSMDFYLCKLDGTALCDGTTGKEGTKIGSSIAVNQATTQPILSAAAQVTSAGRYCWRGVFTSGTTGVPSRSDSRIGECFEVLPVTPTISTEATTVVALGSPISDTATLGGTATQPGSPIISGPIGADAGGTITFKLYGPNDDDCEGTATTVSVEDVSGNGPYTSDDTTPTEAGTYQWVASYAGNLPNTNPKSGACGDANETTKVVDASIAISPAAETNEVNQEHVFTITVTAEPSDETITFDSITPSIDPAPQDYESTCDTPDTSVDGTATCTVTINDPDPGTFTLNASALVTIAGLQLTRDTDPETDATAGPDGSGPATKTYVDASIAISPLTDTNEVGQEHVFNITVTAEPASEVDAFDEIVPTLSPDTADSYASTCSTPDTSVPGTATCTVTITENSAETFTLNASAKVTIAGLQVTRDTDPVTLTTSGPDGSGSATKIYVDASIAISPPSATNNIDEEHVFTITVTAEPAGEVDSFDSITPSIDPTPDSYATTCATPDVVADTATCTVTINHGSAEVFTLNASATVTIAGLQITRDTDPQTATTAGPDGTGPATKTYVEGSLAWIKWDQDDALLAGATFEVCQTHVLVTTGADPVLVEIKDANDDPAPICFAPDVEDDVATDDDPDVVPDADNAGGKFLLKGLSLGTWTIRETAAPPGFAFDDELIQTVELTIGDPDGSAANPFVNTKQFKLIVFTCNQSLGTLEVSQVDLDGTVTLTAGDVPQALADEGVTEAMICGLTDDDTSVYPDLPEGIYTPSVTIPKPV